MSWAEVLAVFNFITWLLPIVFRSYWAWKVRNVSRNNGSDQIDPGISESIKRANISGKTIKFDD